MRSLLQDLRYGWRMLGKNPGFTAVAVLTLALGIGANTAIFSVVDAVLLNRLPYPESSRLVMVWEQNQGRGWFQNVVSAANFKDWRKENHVFSGIAAIDDPTYDLSGGGEPIEVPGEQVSANFFSVLGVHALLGRTFTSEEDAPNSAPVVVLSNALWKERYGADPSVVGRTISLNRTPYTVVGVMPPAFDFPPWGDKSELWTSGLDLTRPERTWHEHTVVARLKPHGTLAQAQAEMDTIARRLESQYPEQKGWGVQLVDLHEQVVGDTRPALLVLLGAVGMVLLIACANLANLQLARLASREKEIAVRAALGAGGHRIARQLLTESVLLAAIGGGLGLLLAGWGVQLLVRFGPSATPGLSQAGVNTTVLGFTLALTVITGIVFGLAPALKAAKVEVNHSLKEGARGSTGGSDSSRLRAVLVCAEFALALVLLVSAGLLIKTFAALSRVNLGFEPHNLLTMRIALEGPSYQTRQRQTEFYRQLLQKVESLPGVASAAALDGGGLPPDGGDGDGFRIVGRPVPPPNETPDASYRVISPDYFRTMGISLVKGRAFSDADNQNAPAVVIINERLAHDYWPGRDPIGSQLEFPDVEMSDPSFKAMKNARCTVVGVVKSVKNLGLELEPREEVYVPYQQYPTYYVPRMLVVRTLVDPGTLTSAIRHEVEQLDLSQPVSEVETMDQVLARSKAGHRFPMVLLGLFAALALVLAVVGIYGVISYSAARRSHEIGIRMALGASRQNVLRLVLSEGSIVVLIGIGAGVIAALALVRLMSSLLYGVRPGDPGTFLVAVTVLTGAALVATYIPARRAASGDPAMALRHE